MCLWIVPVQCQRISFTGNRGPGKAVVTVKHNQAAQAVQATSYISKQSPATITNKLSSSRAPLKLKKSVGIIAVKILWNTSKDGAITTPGGSLFHSLNTLTNSLSSTHKLSLLRLYRLKDAFACQSYQILPSIIYFWLLGGWIHAGILHHSRSGPLVYGRQLLNPPTYSEAQET